MGEFANQIVQVFARKASEQGGVISGDNPVAYNATDPFRLWVIQVVIIIAMTQLLSLGLSRIRQPRVIAEVIGGVLLGPTVMGRIPGFSNAIFPAAGMPSLVLTSTIGLILFLFLVGLEIDTRLLKRNVKASAAVSVAGLLFPLGLGAALGVGVYREFISPSVNFGYFLLFTAVAIGITAFPVLCRILTELKLLETEVGVVTLSAGIGNDVIGWVLLALTVALVNASSGLTALYVLLATVAYVIFLLYPGRWAFVWLARRTGSLEQGSPTPLMMTVTLLIVFISAFYTDIIGVHAIFGGFLAGLIIPHENGFAISFVEKLEDLVSIIFLPIYFTLSGLKTNLGLLNNGVTWGYVIIICLVAFSSKFIACAGAAYATGYRWREAGAIGSLMSCKGLVELIVLNIGLQAGILDTRTFSMFVMHALILTFMTTPLTLLFYPEKYRVVVGSKSRVNTPETGPAAPKPISDSATKSKFAFILEKVEQLPAAMTIANLLQSQDLAASQETLSAPTSADNKELEALGSSSDLEHKTLPPSSPTISINALRLIELTNRTSAVIRSQEADALIYNDPVVSVFKTFGSLNRLRVSANLSVVNYDEFPSAISQHVKDVEAEMVIIPWSRGTTSIDTSSIEPEHPNGNGRNTTHNPFDGIFHKTTTQDQTSSVVYSEYIRNVFLNCPSDVALFVDRGQQQSHTQHLFLPFFGGPDDRLALAFLVQLCAKTGVTGSVVRLRKTEVNDGDDDDDEKKKVVSAETVIPLAHMTVAAADTIYGHQTTQTRLASDTADNVLWDRYSSSPTLSRIAFTTHSTSTPLRKLTELAAAEASATSSQRRSMIVLVGRSRRMAVEDLKGELKELSASGPAIGSSVSKTLGDVGAALVGRNVNASLLVLQAATGV